MPNSRDILRFNLVAIVLGLAVTGCKTQYPACDADHDCKEKEFCVARKCQQCRDNGDCGEGRACSSGRCSPIPGYCRDKSGCFGGQVCIANHCRACQVDSECPNGTRCDEGLCVKACRNDKNCAPGETCVNGVCVAPRSEPEAKHACSLDPVYFDFDKALLKTEARTTLKKNDDCLKKTNDPLNLIGHADPRGTTEYNMALSDHRARAVKDYLKRLGVKTSRLRTVPRGELDATGTDEASWARDRRVDSEWR
jgi:peptidoglycan-associated lipoprotein